MPRLANENVLTEAIQTGANSDEYFAIASGYDGSRYIDLKFNQYIGNVEKSGYLVKVDIAKKQIAEETMKQQANAAESDGTDAGISADISESSNRSGDYTHLTDLTGLETVNNGGATAPKIPANTHFYMSAQLDNTRIGRDVQRLVEEV